MSKHGFVTKYVLQNVTCLQKSQVGRPFLLRMFAGELLEDDFGKGGSLPDRVRDCPTVFGNEAELQIPAAGSGSDV